MSAEPGIRQALFALIKFATASIFIPTDLSQNRIMAKAGSLSKGQITSEEIDAAIHTDIFPEL